MKTKKCISCLKILYLNQFNKDKYQIGGYSKYCKVCSKQDQRKRYKTFPEYHILSTIKARCYNPKNISYKWYGLKGIKCLITKEEIRYLMTRDDYWNLKQPTIDRKDNDGNYTFDNCRFIEKIENVSKATSKIILQFDKQNIFIKEYNSVIIASQETRVNYSNIRGCVQGRQKTAGGFIWKYK